MSKKSKLIAGIIGGVVVIGGIGFGASCIRIIPEGHVGVVYSLNGGTQKQVVEQGLQFVPPFSKINHFTVSQEQLILSRDSREGSANDDSFPVATKDNANIPISFQMSYRFKKDKVSETYNNFKGMDGEAIIDQRVRTVLKSKISEITSKYSMMDIYAGNREKINSELPAHLSKSLSEYGIEVVSASIIDVHPSKQLQESIDAKVKAKQDGETLQLAKKNAEIEAEKALIEAEGKAKVKIANAEADKKVNELKEKSLTENILKQQAIEAWKDGGAQVPQVVGGNGTITNLK